MPENSDPVAYETQVKFIDMFNSFFTSGIMAGTYKAVFLRSLVDLGKFGESDLVGEEWVHPEGDKIKLDLDFIAIRFAKYYWDMEISFHMRHTAEGMADSDDSKDVLNIVKLIRAKSADMKRQQEAVASNETDPDTSSGLRRAGKKTQDILGTPKPPTLEELASTSFEDFRQKVIKKAIRPEVLKNILTDMPDLYDRIRGQNHILLDSDIVSFLKKFSPIINKALNYALASHLEKINPYARHIATKIDSEADFESRLKMVRELEIKIKPIQKTNVTSDDQQAINPTPKQ